MSHTYRMEFFQRGKFEEVQALQPIGDIEESECLVCQSWTGVQGSPFKRARVPASVSLHRLKVTGRLRGLRDGQSCERDRINQNKNPQPSVDK